MKPGLPALVAVALFLVRDPGRAEAVSPLSATFAASVEDAGGTSFDFDARFAPTRVLSFSAGVGRCESADELADLRGRSLRASAAAQGERAGARIAWRDWKDNDRFESRVLSGEASLVFESWALAALLERREFDVGYDVRLGPRLLPQTARFSGRGYGLEFGWSARAWRGYARGMGYDYDDALDRWIALAQLPTLSRLPRIEALTSSVLTRTAGAVERLIAVGVDRAYPRWGMSFDAGLTRDAVSSGDTRSLSATVRRDLSSRVAAEVTLGLSDSNDDGSISFASVALTLR